MKNKITKLFTLLTMAAMSMGVWAEGTVNIPQASAGEYIPIGTVPTAGDKVVATGVTLTGCQVDGNAKAEEYTSYTVGSTNGSPMSIEFALNATAGNYLFTFKSGHAQGTAEISIELRNSSSEVIWNNGGNNVSISNTGSWTLTEAHTFLLGGLAAGTYTLTITGVSKSGSYYGNFGNFCFHTPTTLAMPYDLSHELNVSMATTSGLNISGTYLSNITANSYADDMYMYITDAGYYQVYAGYGYATAGTDQFTITITDLATGTAEVNANNYTVTDSKRYLMKDHITAGWKKIRLDHPGPTFTPSFRLEKMYFIPVQDMPNSNENLLNVTMATVSGMKINGTYLTEITAGSYADDIYMEVPQDGYYQVFAEYGYNDAPGIDNFTITITDMDTEVAEVNAKNYILTGSKKYLMSDYITAGLKKIRLDHPGPISNGSYRLQKMYFIPIQTMPDSPTNLLDITNASVSGMKINGTYLTEISVGSYADDIYVNFEQGGYFQVHAGYGFATAGTDNFTITITDVNKSTDEVDAKNFVITSAQNYLMTDYVTAGLKKIRLDYSGPTITASFRLENMYFDQIPNLPHTDIATLNLNQLGAVFNDCRYEDANANIGYVKNGSYADNYIVYNNIATNYTLHANISWYKKGGTFKITITDVATDVVEVNAQESASITGTGDIEFALNNALTAGFKKIRFDFVNEGESDYLFNIKDVSFSAASYVRTHPHMNLNTLCYPYRISSYTGATFYDILSTTVEDGLLTELVLEEHVGALEAGVPYFYDPTPATEELVCYYSGDAASEGKAANGALVGKFADNSVVPEGSYVTVNNQLYKCGSGVTLAEYRAYVSPKAFDGGAPAPGRKILRIGGNGAPTDVESVQNSAISSQKVLRNGQVIIIRGDKMYNMLGQEL